MLARATDNTSCYNLNNRDMLRGVTVKISLERINIQEGIIVEALLDSGATVLVISSEFARKQIFKLKKLDRPMYVRNVDSSLNKEGPIKHIVEVNIYYQEHWERIDWRTGEVKITRCPEECGKQWRLKQRKPEWQKQKEEEARKEAGKK